MVEADSPWDRRELNSDEQQAVMNSAIALFTGKGLSASFVNDVSAESGIDGRRILAFYGGPVQLLEKLLDRELQLISGSMPAPELRFPGETLNDELQFLAGVIFEEYRSNLEFLKAVMVEAIRNEELGAVFYRGFILRGRQLFTEFLNDRKERGELRRDLDVEASAAFFLSALTFSLLLLEIFGGRAVEAVDDRRLIGSLADLFLKGALARKAE